ncbi:hypothetical protein [Salibaculum halophilum]|uniref:hypothetical protein n=1 Tax=Salibaculum halophilum TaxID=1914408 RepID=UPI000A11658D|nr:hypothetical protein [Salibaculum halophilum]
MRNRVRGLTVLRQTLDMDNWYRTRFGRGQRRHQRKRHVGADTGRADGVAMAIHGNSDDAAIGAEFNLTGGLRLTAGNGHILRGQGDQQRQ